MELRGRGIFFFLWHTCLRKRRWEPPPNLILFGSGGKGGGEGGKEKRQPKPEKARGEGVGSLLLRLLLLLLGRGKMDRNCEYIGEDDDLHFLQVYPLREGGPWP